MRTFIYDNFVRRVSKQFEQALEKIEAEHSFEFGSEFEIAICRTLRAVLPQKYGVCRGYVVNSKGEKAGDDILIYDTMRFPTLRSLGREDYSLKEQVPIEAVYAYIEAKHTVVLEGDGDGTLQKAFTQVSNVKMLCEQRKHVPYTQIAPGVDVKGSADPIPLWPSWRNPAYGAVIARQVRLRKGDQQRLEDPELIQRSILDLDGKIKFCLAPDLVVIGKSNILIPMIPIEGQPDKSQVPSPFFLYERSGTSANIVDGVAFGAGLSFLLWALDWIQLGDMPWTDILNDCVTPADQP